MPLPLLPEFSQNKKKEKDPSLEEYDPNIDYTAKKQLLPSKSKTGDKQGLAGDMVDKFQEGFYNTTGSMMTGARGVFTDNKDRWDIEQSQYDAAAGQQDTLSEKQKEADRKMGIDPEDEITARGVAGLISSGTGSLLPSMFAGGLPGAAGKSVAVALGGKTLLPKVGQAVGFAGGGALQIGGATKNQVEEELKRFTPEQLSVIDGYKSYIDQFKTPEEAKKQFAYDQSQEALGKGGALGALSMGALGPLMQKIVLGGAGIGSIKNILAGAGVEGVQEAVEEGGQTRIANPLTGKEDWQGVTESAVLGAIGGVGAGGVAGGAGALLSPDTKRDQNDEPVLNDQGEQVGWKDWRTGEQYDPILAVDGLPQSDINESPTNNTKGLLRENAIVNANAAYNDVEAQVMAEYQAKGYNDDNASEMAQQDERVLNAKEEVNNAATKPITNEDFEADPKAYQDEDGSWQYGQTEIKTDEVVAPVTEGGGTLSSAFGASGGGRNADGDIVQPKQLLPSAPQQGITQLEETVLQKGIDESPNFYKDLDGNIVDKKQSELSVNAQVNKNPASSNVTKKPFPDRRKRLTSKQIQERTAVISSRMQSGEITEQQAHDEYGSLMQQINDYANADIESKGQTEIVPEINKAMQEGYQPSKEIGVNQSGEKVFENEQGNRFVKDKTKASDDYGNFYETEREGWKNPRFAIEGENTGETKNGDLNNQDNSPFADDQQVLNDEAESLDKNDPYNKKREADQSANDAEITEKRTITDQLEGDQRVFTTADNKTAKQFVDDLFYESDGGKLNGIFSAKGRNTYTYRKSSDPSQKERRIPKAVYDYASELKAKIRSESQAKRESAIQPTEFKQEIKSPDRGASQPDTESNKVKIKANGMISSGEKIKTQSGRTITAPRIDTTSAGKIRNSEKRKNKWLKEEALNEVAGNDYQETLLNAIDLNNLSQSDQDTMNDFLWGDPFIIGNNFRINETATKEFKAGDKVTYQNKGEPVKATVIEVSPTGLATLDTQVKGRNRKLKRPSKLLTLDADEKSKVDIAADEAALSPNNDIAEPTQAQKEAGNYKVGKVSLQGMEISIENPKGSDRTGTDKDGETWSVTMNDHYGYIKGSVGYDKDHVDVFLGKDAETAEHAYIVDQIDPSTGKFDEHKVMIGYDSAEQAEIAYNSNYNGNWKGADYVTKIPMEDFKQWVYSDKPKKGALKKFNEDGSKAKTPKDGSKLVTTKETVKKKEPKKEQVPKSPVKSKERMKLENDQEKDWAALGDFFLSQNSLKIVPDSQRETFTRLLTNLMGSSFKLGYVKFKENAKYIIDTVTKRFGQEAADTLDLQALQGSYIAMSSGRKDATPMVEVVQTTIDDVNNADYTKIEQSETEGKTNDQQQDKQDLDKQKVSGNESSPGAKRDNGNNTTEGSDLNGLENEQTGDVPGAESTGNTKETGVRPPGNDVAGERQPDKERLESSGREDGSIREQSNVGTRGRTGVPGRDLKNFHIDDPKVISGGTPVVRFNKNKASINLYNQLKDENRSPTPEEQAIIAGYTGWGSYGQELFQGTWNNPKPKKGWEERDQFLRDHLGESQWKSAQNSIINAHYTDANTIKAMWDTAEKMGFKGGRVLEPAMGIGNFFGMMPKNMESRSQLTGIELDELTGGMAKMLYPQSNISTKGYQESKTPDNFYDIAISNVPFANFPIADRKYQRLAPNLHDYFFLKMVDQVRPGGLVMAITSKGTMDKINPSIRRALAQKAELVSAIRLPSGAFQEGAGTSVVTDIIILKKRDKPVGITKDSWIKSETYTQTPTPIPQGEKISINQYYHDNVKNVLGTINYGHGTTYGRAGLVVDMPRGLQGRLDKAVEGIPEGIYKPLDTSKNISYITNHTDDRQGSLTKSDSGFYIVSGEHLAAANDIKKYKIKSEKNTSIREDQFSQLINLRKSYAKMIDKEHSTESAEPARKELNKIYKKFVSDHGKLNDSFGLTYLDRINDPFYVTLAALEINSGDKLNPSYTPAKVLTESTIKPNVKIENPGITDSYVIARNQFVSPSLKDVAVIAKKPENEIRDKLVSSGAVFVDEGGDIIPSDVYLSGNVKIKLREAQQAVKDGHTEMQRNVDALLSVTPKDIPYHEIEAKFGASWIKPEIYDQYIKHMLNEQNTANIKVTYRAGKWKADIHSSLNRKPEAQTGFGTPVANFNRLVNYALTNQLMKIYFPKDSDGVTDINHAATDEANQKIANIREEFSEWIWSDPERRIDLEGEYNEVRNAYSEPDFDGSFLTFQGMALQLGENEFNLRQHQVNAIWRAIVKRRSLNAHEVGTGKTFTLGGIAIESRRYGIAKKPVILAHNANSAAVASEIQTMYPAAKILYIDNLDKKNIKLRMQQIANDDWDAIVMPHSQISNLSLKEETLMDMAAEEIEALEAEAQEAAEEDGVTLNPDVFTDEKELAKVRSITAKNLVKERNKIIESIRKQSQKSTREDAISFEDLGIDMILVDEAHEFKKPPIVTKMKMKGFNAASSNRSIALRFLTKYVRKMNNGGNIHLFTGTPITNTLTEIYHQQRYLMEEEMAETGVDYWDGWFGSFASEVQDIEQTSSGEFEDVTRLAAFINIPELRKMIGQYMDVVFSDDMPEMQPRKTKSGKTLSDPTLTSKERNEIENGRTEGANDRPYKKVIPLTEEMSPEQIEAFEEVKRRARRFAQMTGMDKKNAMMNGSEEVPIMYEQYAEKASFDIRLLRAAELAGQEGKAKDTPNSKASRVISNVLEIYKDNEKSSQVIFMDKYISKVGTKSTGAPGEKVKTRFPVFSVARDIEARLIQQGIPAEQIAIVDLNVKGQKRKEIAEKMNTGEIRVVIGSTQSLGVGVNMQKNLRAIHHLNAPWMPGELEQRNGRGHRQGNQWNTVLEYRYLTDRIDGRRWQVLAKKAKFINQFMRSKGDVRNLEGDAVSDGKDDILETFAEAAGDPRILLKEQYKKKIKKLERKERLYSLGISDAKAAIRENTLYIDRQEKEVIEAEERQSVADNILKEFSGDNFQATIKGRNYTQGIKATKALEKLQDKVIGIKEELDVGIIYGYPAFLYRGAGNRVSLGIKVGDKVFSGNVHSIASLNNGLRTAGGKIEESKEIIKDRKLSLKRLEEVSKEPFKEKDQLSKAKLDLVDIDKDMRENPNPPPVWLRNGAPVGTDIYVGDTVLEVTGHKWTDDGYFVVTEDSAKKIKTISYVDVKDKQGMNLYEEVEFKAPEVIQNTDNAQPEQDNTLYSKKSGQQPGQTKKQLLAPNGKPSNLNAKQYAQVRTPEFKAWFGDFENDPENASKVVDENGEPLVVYHGTDAEFDVFDKKKIGSNFDGYDKIGFFFTTDTWEAEGFASGFDPEVSDKKGTVGDYFISSKKPLGGVELEKKLGKNIEEDLPGGFFYEENKEIIEGIIKNGKYDALMVGNLTVAFNPNQIKSATGNTGEFSTTDDRIQYSKTADINGQTKTELLTPNGKPSNLNAKQWAQVRTPEFKAWFGDFENDPENASKVVDENGEPLVVYHGTNAKFDKFDNKKTADIGMHFGTKEQASTFTDGELLSIFLKSKKPVELDFDPTIIDFEQYDDNNFYIKHLERIVYEIGVIDILNDVRAGVNHAGELYDSANEADTYIEGLEDERDTFDSKEVKLFWNNFEKYLKVKGFDGIIYENELEGEGLSYAVFNPNQIKSASGNTGEFSTTDDRIQYAKTADINGLTKSKLNNEIVKQFGNNTKNIIPHDKQSDLPAHIQDATAVIAGAYDPTTGKIHLVAENITQDEVKGLLLHETVHSTLKYSPAYKDAIKTISQAKYSKPYKAAKKAAEDAGVDPKDMNEEILAYMIQNHGDTPLIRKLIVKFRQWLRTQFGITNLSIDEVYDIVNSMARGDTDSSFVLNDGKIMYREGGAKYSGKGENPTFYSELSQQVSELKQTKSPAKQWKAVIDKLATKGVKKEEIEWSGVKDWLDGQEGSVSREELSKFLQNNKVKLIDFKTSKTGYVSPENLGLIAEKQKNKWIVVLKDSPYLSIDFDDRLYDVEYNTKDEAEKVVESIAASYSDLMSDDMSYTKYQVDGKSEGYEELLLTIPSENDDYYKSQHWGEPNVAVHIRFNERIINNKKTLFLEEIQSDWAQDLRKKEPVLNMPFKKTETWAMVGMKRAISWAARNGFDQVAWTPGEVQNKRYPDKKRPDSAMEGFYDNILPKATGKFIKKHKSKVGTAELNGQEVWTFPVTESMKAPLPMFAKQLRTNTLNDAKKNINKLIDKEKELSDKVDKAYAAGRNTIADRLDAKLAQVRSDLENAISQTEYDYQDDMLQEDDHYGKGDDEVSFAEYLGDAWGRYVGNTYLKGDKQSLIDGVHGAINDYGFKPVSDSRAFNLAKKEGENKQKLRGRKAFKSGIDTTKYSKKPRVKSVNEELNQRIREQHKSAWYKAKQSLKRNFSPAGLLPAEVQELRITRDNNLGVTEIDMGELNRKLENAAKKTYGKPIHQLPEKEQKIINDALGGKIPANMSEDIKVAVLAMRQYIDRLSNDYSEILFNEVKELKNNNQNEAAAARAALLETIAKNIGTYVNRSYKAFDDPKWYKKVPEDVLNNAREYLTSNYKPEDLANNPDRVEATINTILKEGTAFDNMEAFIKESKLGAKDLSILKHRKEISPEIRALLGEYQDPRVTFTKSATKMSRLIFNQKFLDKVKEVGIGSFLFTEKDRPADAYKKIASGEAYKPLDGYYTYPEVEQAFKDALGKENLPDWYRTIVQINGMVKYGKTVLSPTTAARNWMSAFFFSMANGHFNMKHMSKSIKNARGYFKNEGNLNYLRELKQLGVVYDTAYAGEMMKLLDDSKIEDKYLAGNIKVKETMDMFTKFYQYGDDFWKIIGYENEIDMLMKHKKLTREQAKPLAAKRIRETYPTYSMTGRAVQKLRRFPLAGTFVSFPAEIIRTSFNMVKLLQQDLKDPDLKALARQRIAGLAIASGFAYALQALAMSMVGVDDDEEEAIRNLAAPWNKNSNIMPVGRDEKGRLRFFDLSFLDPYNYFKRPINALMRDQPVDEKAKEVAREMLTPFLGQDILFSAVDEIWNNKKETGGRIFNPGDNALQNTLDMANHLRKAAQPGIASLMERTYKALSGKKTPSGKTYEIKDEMMGAIGWRVTTFDPKVAIYYKSFKFSDELKNASSILNSVAKNPNKVSDKKLLSAYESAKKANAEAFKNMINLVNAARKSGLSNALIARLLRSNGVSRANVRALIQGKVPDWKPNSRTFLKSSIVRSNNIFDAKTKQEFKRRRRFILSQKN